MTQLLARAPAWLTSPTVAAAVLVTLAAVVAVQAAVLLARRARPGRAGSADRRARAADDFLILCTAAIATAVSAGGMWRVFGERLHMSGPARAATFCFIELAILASARRARGNLRQFGSVGVDGAAVWVLAALTATLSASDAHNPTEVLLRLTAPAVAAWLWERGLASERRQAGRPRTAVAWRLTRQRVLVALRLADPAERAVGDVERARRVAGIVRAAWRLHTLRDGDAGRWRTAPAAARLRRRTLAAGRHLALGTDTAVRDQVRAHLAALYQIEAGTTAAALADLTPWAATPPPDALADLESRWESGMGILESRLGTAVGEAAGTVAARLGTAVSAAAGNVADVLGGKLEDGLESVRAAARELHRPAAVTPPSPRASRVRTPEYSEAVRRLRAAGIARQTAYTRADAAEAAGTLTDLLAEYPTVRVVGEGT